MRDLRYKVKKQTAIATHQHKGVYYDEEMDATTCSSMLFRKLTQAGGARSNGDTNE
jgi:hypothetical protein